ncbi:hypothetical protein BDV12DRAFT_200318 [Aspergillus spectabilis]
MTTESAVDLLHAISRALCEEDVLVRISGTQALGYILDLAMMMFPRDYLVTVKSLVMHEGERKSVLIELAADDQIRPTEIRVETILKISQPVSSLVQAEPGDTKVFESGYFTWEGWVADQLQLAFLEHGMKYSQAMACSQLLVSLPAVFKGRPVDAHTQPPPETGLISLLGSHPYQKMIQACHHSGSCQ